MIECTIVTSLNIGHGRLQVESFCGISDLTRHRRDSLNSIESCVPRGYRGYLALSLGLSNAITKFDRLAIVPDWPSVVCMLVQRPLYCTAVS
jgi:hypothetical protein